MSQQLITDFVPDAEAVAVSVEHRLHSSGYLSLRNIEVKIYQDRILLIGQVPTYYMKQLACVLARSVADDLAIHNLIIVK